MMKLRRKTRNAWLVLALLAGAYGLTVAVSGAARGHPVPAICDLRVEESIRTDYQEVAIIQGVNHAGWLFQVWVGPTGTWSVVLTKPDRSVICLIEGGDGFTILDVPVPGYDPS